MGQEVVTKKSEKSSTLTEKLKSKLIYNRLLEQRIITFSAGMWMLNRHERWLLSLATLITYKSNILTSSVRL